MKVLFLDQHRIGISGAQFRLLDLAATLPAHGITPIVACDPSSSLSDRLRALGVAQVAMVFPDLHSNGASKRLTYNIAELTHTSVRLCQAIRKTRAHVVHVNTLMPRLPGLLAARATRRPVIWHIRDFVVQPAWRRLYRALSPLVDRIIAVSDACRQEFAGHPRARTIYNGLDVDRYVVSDPAVRARLRRELLVAEDGVLIGVVAGTLTPWKGHEVFLDAAAQLVRASHPPMTFVIACDHPAERLVALRERARALGIERCVRFTGFVTEVPALLAALDVAVVPSLARDPLPGAVIEAMAAGRPVVGSRVGGIPEMLEDGKSGFLIDPGDPMVLADRLTRLSESPELRDEMGRTGRATVESRFRLELSVQQLLEVYAGL